MPTDRVRMVRPVYAADLGCWLVEKDDDERVVSVEYSDDGSFTVFLVREAPPPEAVFWPTRGTAT